MGARSKWPVALAAATFAVVPAIAVAAPDVGPRVDRDAVVAPDAAIVPGEAIVRFEPGTTATERLAVRRAADAPLEQDLRLAQTQVVAVDGSVKAAVARLERQPDVAFAQPNYRYRALAAAPNDSFFGDLWGLADSPTPNPGVGALAAWDASRGSGQVIAVVDTGVDLTHPDLAANLWTNPGETQNGSDDDANGRVDDIHGYDFVDGDGRPDDFNFHGTHVAGTAAAIAGNGLGVAGVAPQADVMAVRVLDGDGGGDSAGIADGIAYAAREGADVINLSLGGPAGAGDSLMSSAVTEAGTRGAVVVAAAGNEASNNDTAPTTPCTLPQSNLICVAATTQSGALASFSNVGATTVDVGAPGSAILSAKTDYGTPLLAAGFDNSATGWVTSIHNGGIAWGFDTKHSDGTHSASDSPGDYGAAADTQDYAASELYTAAPVNLTGQRGCRMHYRSMYEIEEPDADGTIYDALVVGAVADTDPNLGDFATFAGESAGYATATFGRDEVSISELDGRSDAIPLFSMLSDGSIQRDGAYVDDLRLICRDATYVNAKTTVANYVAPGAGNYVELNGTSMAAPHVAGVAALVRDAVPDATPAEVVQAIRTGVRPLASLQGKTASGGTVDAPQAIATAIAIAAGEPAPDPLPGDSPPPVGPAPAPTSPATPPGPSAFVDLGSAPSRLRAGAAGRFAYRFRSAPGTRVEATVRTRRRVRLPGPGSARYARLTLAHQYFAAPSTGRTVLRVKLSRRALRVLERERSLTLRVTVEVRDDDGEIATARKRLLLLAPR
jgi:thermitase